MDDGERPCGFGFLCSHVCFFGFIIVVVVVVVGGACRLVSLFSARRKLELKLDEEHPAVMFLFVCAPCSGSSWSDVSVPPLVKLGELFD